MTTTSPAKILLVEDDTDLRESLVDCLELHGYNVQGVADALHFYQAVSGESFDIAIIDIGLPDQCGLEIVSHLKKNNSIGIVVLTAMGSPEIRIKGYESGADLYLVKPIDCRELAAALANLSARLHADTNPSPVAQGPLWELNVALLQLSTVSGIKTTLTVRETTFLKLLMTHPGNTVSREEIALVLALDTDRQGDRRMDSMVRRLRKKIKDASGADLPIQTVYGAGYVFSGRFSVLE